MLYVEWKEILCKINSAKNLSSKNVIKKIRRKLKAKHLGVYKEWKKENFDINYVFLLNVIDKHTLLHISVFYHLKNVMKVLLQCGADVNTQRCGISPLYLAAAVSNSYVMIKTLLENGADVSVKDANGRTFLHWIIYNICISIVDIENLVSALLEGVDVNAADNCGKTLLHHVAECGYIKVIEILLKNGADSLLKDGYGQVPRNLTEDKDIMQFLEAAEKELSEMKDEKIGKSKISFYQFFKAKGAYLADYIRNIDVCEGLREDQYKNRHPIYVSAIGKQYQSGIKRKCLEKSAKIAIGYFGTYVKEGKDKGVYTVVNEDVCRIISSYITDVDLKSVTESVKGLLSEVKH